MAAPKGNHNSMRHGLTVGVLPTRLWRVTTAIRAFRRRLEEATEAAHGVVSLPRAAYIQTACRWERHAMLCQRWLVESHDDLEPADRVHFSREVARASSDRDRAVEKLQLDDVVMIDEFLPITPSETSPAVATLDSTSPDASTPASAAEAAGDVPEPQTVNDE